MQNTKVVAILLIPLFANISHDDTSDEDPHSSNPIHRSFKSNTYQSIIPEKRDAMNAECKNIVSDVLKIILRDASTTESESEPQSEPQSELESKLESESEEPESEPQSKLESKLISESESESESESKLALEPESKSELESELESEPKSESKSELPSDKLLPSQPLTKTLLRNIFKNYGESDLVQDETFIDQMIEAASGVDDSNPQLNAETFLRGISHDIKLYDVLNEYKFQTHYEDVFGFVSYEKKRPILNHDTNSEKEDEEDVELDAPNSSPPEDKSSTIKRLFNSPQIDSWVDNFNSRTQKITIWLSSRTQKITVWLSSRTQKITVWILNRTGITIQKNDEDSDDDADNNVSHPKDKPNTIERVFTFPQIDTWADTFRSRTQYITVWLAVGYSYIAWVVGVGFNVCIEENRGGFGCKVGQAIVVWLAVMVSTM